MEKVKVIIKHKTEHANRSGKYRAGSIVELPKEEAKKLLESGRAIPHGTDPFKGREVKTKEPEEVRASVNNKRRNRLKRDQKRAAKQAEKLEEPAKKATSEEGVKDGAESDNGASE